MASTGFESLPAETQKRESVSQPGIVKVMSAPMWGPLLVLALLTTVNPVRLGIVLFVLLRPRPISSLFAYWFGCVIIGLATVLIPLLVLQAVPTSAAFMKRFADPVANPTAQRIAIGVGVVLILVAALVVLRSAARQRAGVPNGRHAIPPRAGSAKTAIRERDSNIPPALLQLVGSAPETASEGGSAVARLLGRVRKAWQNGSPWPAFVIGVIFLPPLDGLFLVVALIATSGASLEVQLIAAIAYIFGMLAVEEIILVSHLATPAKTEAALRRLHDWTVAHKRAILVAFLAVVGVSMVARGMGGL
ncbi:GAP family protein [Mycobacterium sp. IS-1556]|uniref:GAP family protein n=1 Tax=Mycobacterium sp. IS-1556 TaxID=1772276 RepID=UPI001C12A3FA|nr:GAP family protein [Mycobacterium sp. IS-1556]